MLMAPAKESYSEQDKGQVKGKYQEYHRYPFAIVTLERFIGINNGIPFCSILGEAKLLYFLGRVLIMENTKTYEQEVMWCFTANSEIRAAEHILNYRDESILVVVACNAKDCMSVTIVNLRPPLASLENEEPPLKYKTFFLPHILASHCVEWMKIFNEGKAIMICSIFEAVQTLSIIWTRNGEIALKIDSNDDRIVAEYVRLGQAKFIAIISDKELQVDTSSKYIPKKNKIYDKNQKKYLTLLACPSFSKQRSFSLYITFPSSIIDLQYEQFIDFSLLFLLTSLNELLIYRLNAYKVEEFKTIHLNKYLVREDLYVSCMRVVYRKILIGYKNCPYIAMLVYSSLECAEIEVKMLDRLFYEDVIGIKMIKTAKDNCHCSILLERNSKFDFKDISNYTRDNCYDLNDTLIDKLHCEELDKNIVDGFKAVYLMQQMTSLFSTSNHNKYTKRYYEICQLNLMSVLLTPVIYESAVNETYSKQSCNGKVRLVEFSPNNNTVLILLTNKVLQYYDVYVKTKVRQKRLEEIIQPPYVLLWQQQLKYKCINILCHPFRCYLVILYDELIKFHNFNKSILYLPSLVSNLKNCKTGSFSPLGDKLVLGTDISIIFIDSYSWEIIHKVQLLNLSGTLYPEEKTYVPTKASYGQKKVTKILHISNSDVLVQSGSATYSLISHNEKVSYFGSLERDFKYCYFPGANNLLAYDSINNLAVVAYYKHLTVFSQASLTSNNKCNISARIKISATALKICPYIGILFVGGRNGTLSLIRWPYDPLEEMVSVNMLSRAIFTNEIINISLSSDCKQISAISSLGYICLLQLRLRSDEEINYDVINRDYIRRCQRQSGLKDKYLLSRTYYYNKSIDIIKLRAMYVYISHEHAVEIKAIRYKHDYEFEGQKLYYDKYLYNCLNIHDEKIKLHYMIYKITALHNYIKLFYTQSKATKKNYLYNFECKLREVFAETEAIEKERSELIIKYKTEKKYLLQTVATQQNNSNCMYGLQMDYIVKFDHRYHLIYKQIARNKEYIVLDFQYNCIYNSMLTLGVFNRELEELHGAEEEYMSSIQKYNIDIKDRIDNTYSLAYEIEELKNQLVITECYRSNKQSELKRLCKENAEALKKYNMLIRKSKYLNSTLLQYRILNRRTNCKLNYTDAELKKLEARSMYCYKKYDELHYYLILQKDIQIATNEEISVAEEKIEVLHNKQKEKFDHLGLINSHLQTYEKQCDDKNPHNSPLANHTKEVNDKKMEDSLKWVSVKDSYVRNYFKNCKRLEYERTKLTYRYNDLMRILQDSRNNYNQLKENIKIATLALAETDNRKSDITAVSSLPVNSPVRKRQLLLKNEYYNLASTVSSGLQKPKALTIGKNKKKMVCISMHDTTGTFITYKS